MTSESIVTIEMTLHMVKQLVVCLYTYNSNDPLQLTSQLTIESCEQYFSLADQSLQYFSLLKYSRQD